MLFSIDTAVQHWISRDKWSLIGGFRFHTNLPYGDLLFKWAGAFVNPWCASSSNPHPLPSSVRLRQCGSVHVWEYSVMVCRDQRDYGFDTKLALTASEDIFSLCKPTIIRSGHRRLPRDALIRECWSLLRTLATHIRASISLAENAMVNIAIWQFFKGPVHS